MSSVTFRHFPLPSAVSRRPPPSPAVLQLKLSHIVGLVVLHNYGRPVSSGALGRCEHWILECKSIFAYREIGCAVPYNSDERKLLNKVTRYAKQGTMVALIDASGPGK